MGKLKLVFKNGKNISEKRKKEKRKVKKAYSRFQYSNEALVEAMNMVKVEALSINKASETYQIPKSTLISKLKRNIFTIEKMGPATVLTEEEENIIVQWITQKARIGCPKHPKIVKQAIRSVLIQAPRSNPFTNNLPGEKWFKLFLKRHPEILMKNTEVLSKTRASVTEDKIKDWFKSLKQYLEEENISDILADPSRIFNLDETGVQMCPKTGKLLGETKEKNNYYISPGKEKENITVLCTYSADGKAIRPMIVYPYKRFPPKEFANSVPKGYVIGHSTSGWMTAETFNHFIENGFYKELIENKVKFPVLLLVDGHSSDMNLQLHNFCKSHGIILYCLYPNATHILQPCDVGIFRPLKRYWQKKVAEHSQHSSTAITKVNFAPLFNEAFIEASNPSVIKNAFKGCGLYPFDADAPNYTKCISYRRKVIQNGTLNENIDNNVSDNSTKEKICQENISKIEIKKLLLSNIESNISDNILDMFSTAYENKCDPTCELVLYNVWKKAKDDTCIYNSQINSLYDFPCDSSLNNDLYISSSFIDELPVINTQLKYSNSSDLEKAEIIIIESESILSETSNSLSETNIIESVCLSSTVDIVSNSNSNEACIKLSDKLPVNAISRDVEFPAHIANSLPSPISNNVLESDNLGNKNIKDVHSNVQENSFFTCSEPINLICKNLNVLQNDCTNNTNIIIAQSNEKSKTEEKYVNDLLKIKDVKNEEKYIIKDDLDKIWKKELHFPILNTLKNKKILKSEKRQIFAISSEEWKKQQEEKLRQQEEKQKLKEFKTFERELKRKMKQEEDVKKKDNMKMKLLEESKKKDYEAKLNMLLREKAASLNISNYEPKAHVPKKRKVLKNIANTTPDENT